MNISQRTTTDMLTLVILQSFTRENYTRETTEMDKATKWLAQVVTTGVDIWS
jgi:predicted amino acid-binding ACT domain protein